MIGELIAAYYRDLCNALSGNKDILEIPLMKGSDMERAVILAELRAADGMIPLPANANEIQRELNALIVENNRAILSMRQEAIDKATAAPFDEGSILAPAFVSHQHAPTCASDGVGITSDVIFEGKLCIPSNADLAYEQVKEILDTLPKRHLLRYARKHL